MLKEAFLIFASPYAAQNTVKCLTLLKPVSTNTFCSNSVILSLAAHVTFAFPHLNITDFTNKKPQIIPEQTEVNDYITYHPFQQFWCDSFFSAILRNHVIRKDDTLYIVLSINNSQFKQVLQYKQKLDETSFPYTQKWVDQILKSVSSFDQLPRKNTRHAYLNVSGSQLRKDPFVPIINVRAIILGQIYNNQNWENFDILKGEVPTLQAFLNFDGVIIPGSTNSVLSKIPEIEIMSKNLFQAFQISKKLKIFGICYGHQLIAHKNKGYVIKKRRTDKVEKYQFDEKKANQLKELFPFLKNLMESMNETLLLQHHQDYVQKVSDDFHVLAKSQSSKVECLLHKSGRMLSFQSHPQYFYEYSQGFMQRLIQYKTKDSTQNYINKESQNMMEIHRESSMRMRKILGQFLSWNSQVQTIKSL